MSEEHLDTNALNELRSIMGEDFNLLIDVFISDSTKRLTVIENAISEGNSEELRSSAHGFKGSALNISAHQLTEICKQLEYKGRDNELEGAEALFEQLKEEFEAVKNTLESI